MSGRQEPRGLGDLVTVAALPGYVRLVIPHPDYIPFPDDDPECQPGLFVKRMSPADARDLAAAFEAAVFEPDPFGARWVANVLREAADVAGEPRLAAVRS